MFTVALLGPDAIGTRLARELVHRLPVPALHLRDGPRPDSSNRLPPAGWLLRLLPSGSGRTGRMRRLACWWYRRAGFIVILHGRAEVDGWRSRGWCARPPSSEPRGASPPRRTDLVVILEEPTPLPHLRRLRSLRLGRGARSEPGAPDARVLVVDASRPIGQLVDEIERPIRSQAARHLVALEAPAPGSHPDRVGRGDVR